MIAAVLQGNVSVQETLSKKGFLVHKDLIGERATEPGNPHGSF